MRRLLRLILLLGLLWLLSASVYADGTAVTAMKTECAVEADGACTVTMRVTVDFARGTQEFFIPISPAAKNVSCAGAAYELRSGSGCRLIVLQGSYSGKVDLVISYRLAETVIDDGAAQIFEINLLYPHWNCPISGYEVTVQLPGRFDSMPAFISGYYGDRIDNYMEIRIENGTVHAVLNAKQTLQDHESMRMRLELPKDYFDLRFLAGKTVRVDRLLFLGLLVLTAAYWLVFLRNLPILPKRQAMPPEGGNAGEIPFVLTDVAPDLALMVVQWASLGYLTVTRGRRGRIWLTRRIDMDTERRKYECEIFRTLFSRGDHCDLRSAEYLKAKRLADEKPRQYWQNRIYDPKAGATLWMRLLALTAGLVLCLACFDLWVASKSWRWLLIIPLTVLGGAACYAVQSLGGFLLRRHSLRTAALALVSAVFLLLAGRSSGLSSLMLLNLFAQLTVGLLLRCGGRRTAAGASLAAELLGYRRYLLSASGETLESNLRADPQYYYRVLPFADALQAGKLFSGSLDRVRLEDCDWLVWDGKPAKTTPRFYARYCRLMAGLRGERDPAEKRLARAARQRTVSTRAPLPERKPGGRRASDRPPLRSDGSRRRERR